MTSGVWVVMLMGAAALLPAVLLCLVFLGDRIVWHPRYRSSRWKLYEFQRARPAAFTGVLAALTLPMVTYFVAHADWPMVAIFVLQLVAIYFGARRAVPPFSSEPTEGNT